MMPSSPEHRGVATPEAVTTRTPQSSQGGKHGPSRGQGPLGTWLVIAILTLAIMLMWFLVLGIMEARG